MWFFHLTLIFVCVSFAIEKKCLLVYVESKEHKKAPEYQARFVPLSSIPHKVLFFLVGVSTTKNKKSNE